MADKSLAQKMVIKPGYRIAVINPPDNYRQLLGELPDDVEIIEGVDSESVDGVHLFVKDQATLKRDAPNAIKAVKTDGLIWVSYPKKSSPVKTDISRDVGWEVIDEAGLKPVTQVSVDETWSALRFKHKS